MVFIHYHSHGERRIASSPCRICSQWCSIIYSDDDGSTYVLVNSDLSTKLIKYDSNMAPVWKQLTMPLVVDRLSLPTYYVGTIILHDDDHTVFVLSTIERADAKGSLLIHHFDIESHITHGYVSIAWSAYQAVAYSEPPAAADSVQAIMAYNSGGQVVWAKLVYPPSGCAWVEWFAVSVSPTDSDGISAHNDRKRWLVD